MKKMRFRGENFRELLARIPCCPPSLQTIVKETFAVSTKQQNSRKITSLESFPLYILCILYALIYTHAPITLFAMNTGQSSRMVEVKTAPVIIGPSMDGLVTTKESQRFPEMPALPPLVS